MATGDIHGQPGGKHDGARDGERDEVAVVIPEGNGYGGEHKETLEHVHRAQELDDEADVELVKHRGGGWDLEAVSNRFRQLLRIIIQ